MKSGLVTQQSHVLLVKDQAPRSRRPGNYINHGFRPVRPLKLGRSDGRCYRGRLRAFDLNGTPSVTTTALDGYSRDRVGVIPWTVARVFSMRRTVGFLYWYRKRIAVGPNDSVDVGRDSGLHLQIAAKRNCHRVGAACFTADATAYRNNHTSVPRLNGIGTIYGGSRGDVIVHTCGGGHCLRCTGAANREIADVCENACRIKSDADRRAGIIGESHAVLRRREDVTLGTGVGIGDADVLSGITIFKRNDACGHGWLLFELNSLTFRWAENRGPTTSPAGPERSSNLRRSILFAGSFRCTATPACDLPGLHTLVLHFPVRSDRRAQARVPIVCEKWPFRAPFSWHKAVLNWTAQRHRAGHPEPLVRAEQFHGPRLCPLFLCF